MFHLCLHVQVNQRRCWRGLLMIALVPVVLGASTCSGVPADPGIPVFTYQVVNSYPHDATAFTQGLLFHEGVLYESTGLYGSSSIRRVDLTSGEVLQIRHLQDQFFGEGLVLVEDRLIQLTWREGVGFIYRVDTFEQTGDFHYTGEGWGFTFDGIRLILSDGTAWLRFLDPETFEEIGSIEVRDTNGPVKKLNELEYIDGSIYANIYETSRIARIDPATGMITAWIDLSGLLTADENRALRAGDVLNGIAHDPATNRWFVTGKHWPRLFEIELQAAE